MKKRLFFAVGIEAPWPATWPEDSVLDVEYRHCTVAFLGEVETPAWDQIPKPPFRVGPSGWFDKALKLPEKTPRVIAWHITWRNSLLHQYQATLAQKFQKSPGESQEPWLSHLTLCRRPLKADEWLTQFAPLPCFASSLHLYESLGHSRYRSLWSYPIAPAFEELEHTADIAFRVLGSTPQDLYANAFTALAFKCPQMLNYWEELVAPELEDIVEALNQAVCRTDAAVGCPFKAVSLHGEIVEIDGLLNWEMIVDV